MVVLRYVPVVEIGDPKIQQNVEKKRKIQDDKIKAIIAHPDGSLYGKIDPKNPDRFYEKIKKEEQPQVGQEFFLHEPKIKVTTIDTFMITQKIFGYLLQT